MTHEEIEATIKRIQEYDEDGCKNAAQAVIAFMGGEHHREFQDKLVSLLRQADPKTHIKLPKDANGEVINVGDELCGYGYPDGDMHCQAVINDSMILAGRSATAYKSWLMWSASECRHYHKPTVEDVLRDFVNRVMSYNEDEDDGDAIISDCANRLRKLMADE